MLRNKRKNANNWRYVRFGWGGWIRTNEMAESESAALPLGDTPKSKDGTNRPVPLQQPLTYEAFLVKPANFLLNLDN